MTPPLTQARLVTPHAQGRLVTPHARGGLVTPHAQGDPIAKTVDPIAKAADDAQGRSPKRPPATHSPKRPANRPLGGHTLLRRRLGGRARNLTLCLQKCHAVVNDEDVREDTADADLIFAAALLDMHQ